MSTPALGNGPERGSAGSAGLVVRAARGFGRFWWDFLVGDTPELFVGTLAVLGLLAGLWAGGAVGVARVVLLPVLVLGLLGASLYRAQRSP